jgi:fused signal recognition particle receptor
VSSRNPPYWKSSRAASRRRATFGNPPLEDALQGRRQIDADLLDELEFTLISADIGVRTTGEILESIRERVARHRWPTPPS